MSDNPRSNVEKLKNAFYKALELTEQTNLDDLAYGSIPEWDSLGHMALISEVEDSFQIELTTEEVIDFSSFQAGVRILRSRSIQLEA